jgi:hypothetical protein
MAAVAAVAARYGPARAGTLGGGFRSDGSHQARR